MRVSRTVAALIALNPAVHAERLTIERIFSDPDLDGPSPRALQIAPDGSRVTFLRGRADDQNRLDRWAHDVAAGNARRVVDSAALDERKELSDTERARRERERIAQLKGIVTYRWAPDSRTLPFSVGERLWLYASDALPDRRLRARTPSGKLLLVHGMADDDVLFANSTRLVAALQWRGTQFRLMMYPVAKHGPSTPALKKHVCTMIARYFDEKLKSVSRGGGTAP